MTRACASGSTPTATTAPSTAAIGHEHRPDARRTTAAPAPFSEPESEAVHRLSQTRNIVLIITHHTYTDDGVWLREPGFCFSEELLRATDDVVPDEAGMKLLGDSMAQASRLVVAARLGDRRDHRRDRGLELLRARAPTATRPSSAATNFHPGFATRWSPASGPAWARRSCAPASSRATAPATRVLRGAAPAGRVLRLRKSIETPTSLEGVVVDDEIDLVLKVPASGRYEWDVNPSTRPLSTAAETYAMTCETAAGKVIDTRAVFVARGSVTTADFACGQAPGSAPTGADSKLRVRLVRPTLRASRLNRSLRIGLRVTGGRLRKAKLVLADARGRAVASRRVSALGGRTTVSLRRRAKLRRGAYRLRVSGRDASGVAFRQTLKLRLR